MVKMNKQRDMATNVIVGVGALNLGLAEVLDYNVIDTLLNTVGFANFSIFAYGLVGIAGAYSLYKTFF